MKKLLIISVLVTLLCGCGGYGQSTDSGKDLDTTTIDTVWADSIDSLVDN